MKEGTENTTNVEQGAEKQILKDFADGLIRSMASTIEADNKTIKEQKEYKEKYGKEDHHHSVWDMNEVTKNYFALVGLQTEGIISEADLKPISDGLKNIMEYEVGRLEARAESYAVPGTGKEDEDGRRQAILNGEAAFLTKSLLSYLK